MMTCMKLTLLFQIIMSSSILTFMKIQLASEVIYEISTMRTLTKPKLVF